MRPAVRFLAVCRFAPLLLVEKLSCPSLLWQGYPLGLFVFPSVVPFLNLASILYTKFMCMSIKILHKHTQRLCAYFVTFVHLHFVYICAIISIVVKHKIIKRW